MYLLVLFSVAILKISFVTLTLKCQCGSVFTQLALFLFVC